MFMLKSTHRREVAELSERNRRNRQLWNSEIDRLTDKLAKAKEGYDLETANLRNQNISLGNDIARLKGLLVARDHADGKVAGEY